MFSSDPVAEVPLLRHPLSQTLGFLSSASVMCSTTQADGQRLELVADLADLLHLLPVQLADDAAPMPVERDEPLRRQIAERLADGGRAHAQLRGEVCLDQSRATGQVAAEDGPTQRVLHEFMRGSPFPRVGGSPSHSPDCDSPWSLGTSRRDLGFHFRQYVSYKVLRRRGSDSSSDTGHAGATSPADAIARTRGRVDGRLRARGVRGRLGRPDRLRPPPQTPGPRGQEALQASDIDALLLWKDENVRYLTSLRAQLIAGKMTSLNGVLLTRDSDPILLCSGGEIDKATMGMSWLTAAHAIPIMEQARARRRVREGDAGAAAVGARRERGTPRSRSGQLLAHRVDGSPISPNLQPTDGDALMQRVRLIKSHDEIAIIQESCAIGDSVTRRAIDATKEGRRENEIAGDAMQTLYYLGGEMAHVITPFVASGEHMSPPHRICTDKIVRNGDLCFIDIGAMWNGYFADIGRTIDHRHADARCRSASTPPCTRV